MEQAPVRAIEQCAHACTLSQTQCGRRRRSAPLARPCYQEAPTLARRGCRVRSWSACSECGAGDVLCSRMLCCVVAVVSKLPLALLQHICVSEQAPCSRLTLLQKSGHGQLVVTAHLAGQPVSVSPTQGREVGCAAGCSCSTLMCAFPASTIAQAGRMHLAQAGSRDPASNCTSDHVMLWQGQQCTARHPAAKWSCPSEEAFFAPRRGGCVSSMTLA